MLEVLREPERRLGEEVSRLEGERQELIKATLHYK